LLARRLLKSSNWKAISLIGPMGEGTRLRYDEGRLVLIWSCVVVGRRSMGEA